jgi:hypothetical protein
MAAISLTMLLGTYNFTSRIWFPCDIVSSTPNKLHEQHHQAKQGFRYTSKWYEIWFCLQNQLSLHHFIVFYSCLNSNIDVQS